MEARADEQTSLLFEKHSVLKSVLEDSEDLISLRKHRKLQEYERTAALPKHLEAKIHKAQKRAGKSRPGEIKSLSVVSSTPTSNALVVGSKSQSLNGGTLSSIVNPMALKPQWHPPWKLMRVITGHLGWVRSLAVDSSNEWFATGSADKTIKIWDLASGVLRLTLTGHSLAVRGLAISERSPYMFSVGEDKQIKCWDLEHNKAMRDYHGHKGGVYTVDTHPSLDVIVTAGRDGVAKLWDIRQRVAIHTFVGHEDAIASVKTQQADPQVITASLDKTVKLWDIRTGKCLTTLTHHRKGVRALALHPDDFTFASCSTGDVRAWKLPEGQLLHKFDRGQDAIINCLSVNSDGVTFAGGNDGTLGFYDWNTGHKYQQFYTTPLPGALDSERGILASSFDRTGSRLITCETDKSIKVWREDPDATEESHPGIKWVPGRRV